MPERDGQAGDLKITPAMIDAGVSQFVRWFELPEHQEAMVELPIRDSIARMVSSSFLAMEAAKPEER